MAKRKPKSKPKPASPRGDGKPQPTNGPSIDEILGRKSGKR